MLHITITTATLIVSIAAACFAGLSASFAGAAWRTGREKLRLDLYNRRFDIYVGALKFSQVLEGWQPTDAERQSGSFKDSPELDRAQRVFIKATREAGFLFPADSGVQKRLEQMHTDGVAVIGYKLHIARNPCIQGPDVLPPYNNFLERSQRIRESIGPLEKDMAEYLNFHALSAWRWWWQR
jgi:hypothetical protein